MALAGRSTEGGLMSVLSRPETWQWLSGVGAGLSRAGRGQPYDISGANAQLYQSLQDRQAQRKLGGLMDQFGLNPQQRGLLGQLPLEMQQKILAQQAFPQGGKAPTWEQHRDAMIATGTDPITATRIAVRQYRLTDEGARMDMATGMPPGQVPGAVPSQGPAVPPAAAPPSVPGSITTAPPPPAETPPERDTLWGSLDAATGVRPAVEHLSTNTLGQIPGAVGEFFSYPETVKARRLFATSVRDLARSLADNPRYPEGMMQDIIRRSGMEAEAWTSEDSTRSGLLMMDGFLRGRIREDYAFLSRSDISAAQRNDTVKGIQAMESFLRLMGVPQGAEAFPEGSPENPIDMRAPAEAEIPPEVEDVLRLYD